MGSSDNEEHIDSLKTILKADIELVKVKGKNNVFCSITRHSWNSPTERKQCIFYLSYYWLKFSSVGGLDLAEEIP